MPSIPRLIFHIGSHKTGSSSLQRFLDESRALLQKGSVCYPKTGQGPADWSYGQHELPRLAGVGDGNTEAFEKLCDDIVEEFVRSGCETLLLSSEDFFTCGNKEAIARRFRAEEVQVVVSLRPQHEQATAIYYNLLLGYRGMLPSPMDHLPHLEPFLNYGPALTGWRNLYPEATFRLRRFEKGQGARTDSIRDFIQTLELPLTPPDPARFRDNSTIPAKGILFLRTMRPHGFTPADFLEAFRALQANGDLLGTEKSVYSPDERRGIHETYRERNRRLRAEFGDGLHADYFDEPDFGDESLWRSQLGDQPEIERSVFLELLRKLTRLKEQTEKQNGPAAGAGREA